MRLFTEFRMEMEDRMSSPFTRPSATNINGHIEYGVLVSVVKNGKGWEVTWAVPDNYVPGKK